MDAVVGALICFSVCALLIYVVLILKNRNSEEAHIISTDKSDGKSYTKGDSISFYPSATPKNYVSIYEYSPNKTVKKCAYCDGENIEYEKYCRICGNNFYG